jgi:hypothetical protein
MISDQCEYEEYLRALDDDQLRDEWVELRRNYNLARVELGLRQMSIRERKSSQLPRLIAAQRMREAVSKLKEEMKEDQLFICEAVPPEDGDESF